MEGHPLASRKHWILDNDGKYGDSTTAILGKRAVWTSIRAPDMNAYCERFEKTISEECLNQVTFLSEGHLREYVIGYGLTNRDVPGGEISELRSDALMAVRPNEGAMAWQWMVRCWRGR